ncbi:prolyl oligopeptidase family serine peptidase [Flavobacteriaceae bacterium M23B6Z8]
MYVFKFVFIFILLLGCKSENNPKLKYPKLATKKTTEIYHGIEVTDNHKILEDLENPKVIGWFRQQAALTDSLISKIKGKKYLYNKICSLDEKYSANIQFFSAHKNGYYYVKKANLNQPGILYYRQNEKEHPQAIFDPSTYKQGFFINDYKVSWDQAKIVISLTTADTDQSHLLIYDAHTGNILPEIIKNANPALLGGLTWLPDNSGFIYVQIPHFDFKDISYLENTKAVLYKLGDPPTMFSDIFSKKNNPDVPFLKADRPVIFIKDQDSKYIFGAIGGAASFKDLYYASISEATDYANLDWQLLFTKDQKIAQFYIQDEDLIYRTAKDASNFKICKTSIQNPDFENPSLIINEKVDEVITDFHMQYGKLFYTTLKNGVSSRFFMKSGHTETEIELPYTAGNLTIEDNSHALYISIGGWTRPSSIFKYNEINNSFIDLALNELDYSIFDNLIVEEIEIESHDGVSVPMSIIYKKGLKKDGRNNTLLLSYGSYGVSFSPYFSIPFLTWVLEGGIWAIPHIRGGGEKGDSWHKAGYKTTKPNTWKDLIACTEYLIKKKYSAPDRIVNYGASAGGIAVGRSITERPDLYAAAAMAAPSLNLVRSEFQPNGPNNIKEFGSVKNKEEFMALLEMDSYHQIKDHVNYPAIIINIGMNDGIVTPWDPAKFIARLQDSEAMVNPVLLSVKYDAGHFVGDNKKNFYEDISEMFSFALWQLGDPAYQIN